MSEANPYILVVDDDTDGREMLARYLVMRGHDVLQADNTPLALDLAAARVPALILLDVAMPTLDGMQTVRHLKANPITQSAIVIAVTGRAYPVDEARAMAAGFDVFITKPYDLFALADAVTVIMRDGRAALPALVAAHTQNPRRMWRQRAREMPDHGTGRVQS